MKASSLIHIMKSPIPDEDDFNKAVEEVEAAYKLFEETFAKFAEQYELQSQFSWGMTLAKTLSVFTRYYMDSED